MDTITSTVLSWWRKKRLQYNKNLLFTALMGFVAQAVVQPFSKRARYITDSLPIEMREAAMAVVVFMILANIAFTAGCVIDLIFNSKNSFSFRERLYLIGNGFAIIALISSIIAFLYLN